MKSLKDYSLNLPEQEYHDFPAWSHSIIAKYARNGFAALSTLHDKFEPTAAMRFGSLFDSIITRGKETLNHYTVTSTEIPEAERKALEYIASQTTDALDTLDQRFITDCCDRCGYQTRWGFEARFKHLIAYEEYYNKLRSDKEIVSECDWTDAVDMANIFHNDPYLKTIFGKPGNHDGIEYIYQPQFLVNWNIEGEEIPVKVMLDLIRVNHNNKTIQPVELKTSDNPAYSFSDNFIRMRYDIEAETYTDVLRKVCDTVATEYKDYTILPYLFTDISRSDKVPVTYVYDPSNGFSYTKNDRTYTYKGWKELLAEILLYEANNASVPNYIVTDGPNDIIDLLSR